MNKPVEITAVASASKPEASVSILQREVAIMAGRFAGLLRQRFSEDTSVVQGALTFLEFRYQEQCGNLPISYWSEDCSTRIAEQKHSPCYQLYKFLELTPLDFELLILAGLSDEHEGYADVLRTLHPTTQPYATLGLAAQLLCQRTARRQQLRLSVESSFAASYGLFISDEDLPFYTRSIRLPDKLWSLLQGLDVWPNKFSLSQPDAVSAGLSNWFKQADLIQIQKQLRNQLACTVMLTGETTAIAADRAIALCASLNMAYVVIEQLNQLDQQSLVLLQLHCLVRKVIPILKINHSDKSAKQTSASLNFNLYPLPIIVCAELGAGIVGDQRALLSLRIATLDPASLQRMWQQLLPELTAEAKQLASRYPFEPVQAKHICDDLHYLYADDPSQINLATLADAVRARSTSMLNGGVQLIEPISGWHQLVLPEAQLAQIQDASQRLFLQSKVLDQWKFLQGRRGARGVRLLFAGPPGTGKTLAAEVLANSLGVDLLLVDLSRVVSKWVGETEKNLAEVFVTAESSKSVLFFDEADALFGKRTEVSDAHDRYANLETAYLLSRLERYDGLAILATNYRQNIDPAFSRRLEFIVEFEEPGYEERLKLWQCHLPEQAPLDPDVRISELASLFPIVGGHIRNASVAAAYLAAQENSRINRQHFIEAIRREYEKAGKAYREISTR